ncbi:hypothetical protein AOQ84DRAFT_52566 [Glonium stellatum]|uniref:Uncharacterized protein n=1 Tax=Glonium stellatum TaxID=574774 RepID=A0A8E2EZR8_9PEZI|nr:hypothetical protein AOQ84DRAFT_52566 [Glonium stellatum]
MHEYNAKKSCIPVCVALLVYVRGCYYNREHGWSAGTQARDSGTHISHAQRIVIDYYSQGRWIKLLTLLRGKLRGAGRFPVGLSETFYAAFSKDCRGPISKRMCARSGGQQIPKRRFPSKHSQNPEMRETWRKGCGEARGREIFRYKKLLRILPATIALERSLSLLSILDLA